MNPPSTSRDLVAMLRPYLSPEAAVLDYRAGGGDLTMALLEAGYRVAAFEDDPARRAGLAARIGDAPNFLGLLSPEETRQFDVVMFVDGVDTLPAGDMDDVLSHIQRLTRIRGVVVITAANGENRDTGRRRRFTMETLAVLIGAYGFARSYVGRHDLSARGAAQDRGALEAAYRERIEAISAEAAPNAALRVDNLRRALAAELDARSWSVTAGFPFACPGGTVNGDAGTIVYIGARPSPRFRVHREWHGKARLNHSPAGFRAALERVRPGLAAGTIRLVGVGQTPFLPYYRLAFDIPFMAVAGTEMERLACESPSEVAVMALAPTPRQMFAIAREVWSWGDFPVVPSLLGYGYRDITVDKGASLLAAWRALLRRPPSPAPAGRTGKRATLLISAINPGGAERQLCYLAIGLKLRGWQVNILTVYPQTGAAAHYVSLLDRHGIPVDNIAHPKDCAEDHARWFKEFAGPATLAVIRSLSIDLVHLTIATCRRLAEDRPDMVVGYLDTDNLRGALAGLFAGVPDIVMVGRSLHPGNFPVYFADICEYYQTVYRLVLRSPRVRFLNNSGAGAASYADWLSVPAGRIGIVNNAVLPDMLDQSSPEQALALRREWGIGADQPVIAGLFRFAPEKRPFLFLRVVERLAERFPDLHAVIVGDGFLREEIEHAIRFRRLERRVRLLGSRGDVPAILGAADMLLHVSLLEGFPNAILEAQLLGRPVVATRAGGSEETVAAALRPFLCGLDDEDGLVEACTGLLGDRASARALGATAAREIQARYTLEALTDGTLCFRAHGRAGPQWPTECGIPDGITGGLSVPDCPP